MHRFTSLIRRPVKRQGSEQYIFITLLSFAASVILTRLFLTLTGYPQLGGGGFHIAHVLWGGLLLFAASLLPLIVANRWAYTLCAVLAGAGVGLFIDEVGKFITQSNDYFYPLAAPIIYALFLVTVMLYLRVRRPPLRGPRAELYRAFDAMEEVLEHDLDAQERADLEARLRYVAENGDQPDLARLAADLLQFLSWDALKLTPRRQTFVDRFLAWWRPLEERHLHHPLVKAVLTGALLAVGLMAMVNMFRTLPIGPAPTRLEPLLRSLIERGYFSSLAGLNWFFARTMLEASVGLMLLVAAGMFLAGKDKQAAALAYVSLLLSLTVVNLLVFYFDQFSTIVTAMVEFTVLMIVAYYRQRFLVEQPLPLPAPEPRPYPTDHINE